MVFTDLSCQGLLSDHRCVMLLRFLFWGRGPRALWHFTAPPTPTTLARREGALGRGGTFA